MKLFEHKQRLKESINLVELDLWQPKTRLSYKENGEINEKGQIKIHFDTFGDGKWSWQTPKESSQGWFVKVYNERIYIENYINLYQEHVKK